MNVPRGHRLFSPALTILLSLALTACATSRRGERVGGIFDEDNDAVSDGRGDYYRGGGGGGGGPEADSAPVEEMSVSAGAVARPRGLFDFGGGTKKSEAYKSAAPAGPPPATTTPDKPNDAKPEPSEPPDRKSPEASGPRLVIYKGNLTVMVTVVDASVEKLSARAKELGGYLENQTSNGGANNATVTLRVPAEKFYDLLNELGTYGQVVQKNISAEDVTKRVFDVELRLDTAEKSRARLLDLLKQATKMEDVLQIENEVRRLTDEIEGMKGELRFLKDQVSLSTLTVTFYSNAPPPTAGPTRTRSRFEWINKVGIEPVLNNF